MLGTRIHRSLTVLAAAGAFAAAAAGPATSGALAAKNTGAYAKSSEAQKRKAHDTFCEDMWTFFEGDVNAADQAYKNGDMAGFNEALGNARSDIKGAKQAGCGWAMRVKPPSKRLPIAVQVAPARAS